MKDFYCDSILTGKIPINKVLETDNVIAFYHTKPHWPVHIAVIPKKHISSFLSLTENDNDLILELTRATKQVASQLVAKYGGARILTNIGAYQDSKHFHYHVIFGEPLVQK